MMPSFPHIDAEKKTLEGLNISRLMEQYGSPLLILCERIMREKYGSLKRALDAYYPYSQITYALEANYLPGVVKIFKNLGANAAVSSGFEYWLARQIGFTGDHIIFNGTDKKTSEIETAVRDGALINVDNYDELERIGILSGKIRGWIKIGLRINADIPDLAVSRFGFSVEDGCALKTAKTVIRKFPKLIIAGLHIHMNTNLNDAQYYVLAAEKLSDLATALKKELSIRVEFLDLGGGFAVPGSRWKDSPIWVVPDVEDYISSIANAINQRFMEAKPKLLLEPGRFLVDEAGIFLTTIKSVKEARGLRPPTSFVDFSIKYAQTQPDEEYQLIHVDSSIASVPKSASIRHKFITHIRRDEKSRGSLGEQLRSHIAGNSSLEHDFLAWDESMPESRPDDKIAFYNTGAYTISRSEQFIHPRPAVLLLEENGKMKCIRRKETFEDMISLDSEGG